MSRSGIKSVSEASDDLALRALTWGITVSEAGVEPIAHLFIRAAEFPLDVSCGG